MGDHSQSTSLQLILEHLRSSQSWIEFSVDGVQALEGVWVRHNIE